MNSMWDKFIEGYCKVGFLCENNDPNWLGWFILIVLGTIVSLIIIFGLLSTIEQEIMARRVDAINKRKKLEIVDKEYNLY